MNGDERVAVGRATYARNLGVDEATAEATMIARSGTTFTRSMIPVHRRGAVSALL